MGETILSLLSSIVIGVISAWVTVQLSLRRFRSERWWERKVEAYERVISKLHDAMSFASQNVPSDMIREEPTPDEQSKLRVRSKIAQEEIAKTIDLGAFLLSDGALTRLIQYQSDEDRARSSHSENEYLVRSLRATRSCLDDFIVLARRDLEVAEATSWIDRGKHAMRWIYKKFEEAKLLWQTRAREE